MYVLKYSTGSATYVIDYECTGIDGTATTAATTTARCAYRWGSGATTFSHVCLCLL